MTFQPFVPVGGYAGWSFLQRTLSTQQDAFNASAQVTKDSAYFAENIGEATSAEDLLSDRRLLSFALGAFGLEDDIDNKFFVQKVLTDGTIDRDALANKLSDKRYLELSGAFGFGDFDTPNTVLSTFPDTIVSKYKDAQFEVALGEQDESMRLALNFEREIRDIAEKDTTDNGRWYAVLGNPAIRTVFESALGLPASIGSLDLDQQLSAFRDKAETYLGDSEVSALSDQKNRESIIKLYFLRSELAAQSGATSSAQNALALLSQ